MKKLILASAVAALMASNTAMADTTFGGNIRLNLQSQEELALNSGKLTFDIKASEDLGNGMTGIARIEWEHDNADNEITGLHNDLSYVGLKGDFGQVTAGVQDDAAAFACGATDIFVSNSGAACGTGAVNGPLDNAIVYANTFDAITVVAGLTFDGDIASGADQDADPVQPAEGNHTLLAVNFDGGSFGVGGQIIMPDGDLDLEDRTVIGGHVMLGEVKLGLTFASNGEDNHDTATAIAVSLPLAGGTFSAGIDTAGDDEIADFAGNVGDVETITNIQFDKKLSKAVYVGAQYSAITAAFGDDPDDLIQGYMGYKF